MGVTHDNSIAVLGSTGSIGRQALEVAAFLGLEVRAIAAAGSDLGLLLEQTRAFLPQIVAVADGGAAGEFSRMMGGDERLKAALGGRRIELLGGADGVCAAAAQSAAQTVVSAISGAAGLPASISAVKAGKTVALANKETLVMAGRLVMGLSARHSAPILPVDSEHSAIFQCLRGQARGDAEKLILTASGGPFLRRDASGLVGITPEQASAHPTWRMGRKISIDSATLMNKGLEVIEASMLFEMGPDQIDVLIHPQSVVHSMVVFRDGAVLAQMGVPDMRAPIQYALTYPERREGPVAAPDFAAIGQLTFEAPDFGRFPCLSLAYTALRAGGTAPAALNAANEAAVELFVGGKIKYTDIPRLVESAMEQHAQGDDMSIDDINEADRAARAHVYETAPAP